MRFLLLLHLVFGTGWQTPYRVQKVSAESLLKSLPAGTIPPRRKVVEAENGWPLAVQAAGPLKNAPDAALILGRVPTTPAEIAAARRVLVLYKPRLKLLTAALARPIWLQSKARDPFVDFPNYAGLKNLAKLLVLRADLALHDGRPMSAMTDLLAARDMGRLVADSDGMLIGYLVGAAIQAIANRALQRAAWHPNVDAETLRTILPRVPEGAAADPILARAEISELRDGAVPSLARLRGEDMKFDPTGLTARVLRDHPHPFEAADTLRRMTEALRIAVANTSRSWKDQEDISLLTTKWIPGFNLDEDEEEVDLEKIAAYRAAAAKVTNPLGRATAASTASLYNSIGQGSFKTRADESATRATLLLALAARENGGALPPKLPEFVFDPFSGGALNYDPVRALIWSVGPDARDDRADGLPGALSAGRDLVWSAQGRNSASDRAKTTPPPTG